MSKTSNSQQNNCSQALLAEAIRKHCLLALSGEYEQLPAEKQLILIAWIREANKRLIDERKRVALIVEARKLGLIEDIKQLE